MTAFECFLNSLANVINDRPADMFLVCGDFNLPNIKWLLSNHDYYLPVNFSDDRSQRFVDAMSLCNLKQYSGVPNVVQRTLDLMLTDNVIECISVASGIVTPDPYHPPIEFRFGLPVERMLNYSTGNKYNFRGTDFDKLRHELGIIEWGDILGGICLDESVDGFYIALRAAIDKCVPKKSCNQQRYPFWYARPTIKAIKEKRRVHTRWKRYGSQIDCLTFGILRGRCKFLIEQDYKRYITNIQNEISDHPKKLWSFVSDKKRKSNIPATIIHNDGEATRGEDIVEVFSNFFKNVFVQSTEIELSQASLSKSANSIKIELTGLRDCMIGLDASKGSGPDGVPSVLLRECAQEISIPLCIIFNRSLSTGVFPAIPRRFYI